MTKAKRAAIYLRVSTDGQTTDNQRLELERVAEARGWEVVGIYRDHGISGAKFGKDRPDLERLRQDAARRKFDVVMAWHIDRIGRSTAQVAAFIEEMESLGVAQFYHAQGMDASTTYGRGMIQMALVFAEIERGMIRERVKAGLARAKAEQARGIERKGRDGTIKKAIGRPKTPAKTERIILGLRAKGMGMGKIAKQAKVGCGTVQRVLKEALEATAG